MVFTFYWTNLESYRLNSVLVLLSSVFRNLLLYWVPQAKQQLKKHCKTQSITNENISLIISICFHSKVVFEEILFVHNSILQHSFKEILYGSGLWLFITCRIGSRLLFYRRGKKNVLQMTHSVVRCIYQAVKVNRLPPLILECIFLILFK